MTSQTETVVKPAVTKDVKKAPAVKKAKKAVKTAPAGEKTLSYQEMVKQAVAETKSRTGSSLTTIKKFVIGKFPVDAVKAPVRILKAVNALKAAGALVSAAPAGRKGAHSFKLAPVDKGVKKVVKPKTAKVDKAAPKKTAKKAGATKKPAKKAVAAKKPAKKPAKKVARAEKTSVKVATKKSAAGKVKKAPAKKVAKKAAA